VRGVDGPLTKADLASMLVNLDLTRTEAKARVEAAWPCIPAEVDLRGVIRILLEPYASRLEQAVHRK
jgi:hypothetical protein